MDLAKGFTEVRELQYQGYTNHVVAVVAPLADCQRRGRAAGKQVDADVYECAMASIPPMISVCDGSYEVLLATTEGPSASGEPSPSHSLTRNPDPNPSPSASPHTDSDVTRDPRSDSLTVPDNNLHPDPDFGSDPARLLRDPALGQALRFKSLLKGERMLAGNGMSALGAVLASVSRGTADPQAAVG